MIAEGLGALTTVMTLSRGPHWNIEKERVQRVGNAWAAVIQHYFPDDTIGEYSLLTGAVIATGAAFGPPLIVDIAKARATAAAHGGTPATPATAVHRAARAGTVLGATATATATANRLPTATVRRAATGRFTKHE